MEQLLLTDVAMQEMMLRSPVSYVMVGWLVEMHAFSQTVTWPGAGTHLL